MEKVKYFIFSLICLFSCGIVFAENEVVVKSITPVYDDTSTVEVTNEGDTHNVVFNDKNQSVKYNVVIENVAGYDLEITSADLTQPTEDFLEYKLEGLNKGDVLKSEGTKELVLSFETVQMENWGRNFSDDLIATISFEKAVVNQNTVVNPNTKVGGVVIMLAAFFVVAGMIFVVFRKHKIARYAMLILALSAIITVTKAQDSILLSIKTNVSFESQNVMKPAYYLDADNKKVAHDFWAYNSKIKTVTIENEIEEIKDFAYKFDVSDDQNKRIYAYLVPNKDDSAFYDLHIQADGIIYANQDASRYFYLMSALESINSLEGLDTSNVTDMNNMFYGAGYSSKSLSLDLSSFDTSKVTNMSSMFQMAGASSSNLVLDLSNFDTSNVTDMSVMFCDTGYSNPNFTLDVSNFDTSNVTNMRAMFANTGYNATAFTLDVSNFDTSNVTNMSGMFASAGYSATDLVLDVSNFDTSKVTDMDSMFASAGYSATDFVLDVSNFDTSKVTDMDSMFEGTGYSSETFTLDVSNFDTSNVTNMKGTFANTGYNSTKLNTSITITNPDINSYSDVFNGVAVMSGAKFVVNYTSKTSSLVDKMLNTRTESCVDEYCDDSVYANVVKGGLEKTVTDDIDIGDEFAIGNEHFNVISQTNDTVTMLAKYNIDNKTNKQVEKQNYTQFSDNYGWAYEPAPKEIDIQQFEGETKSLLNNYVSYLQTELDGKTVSGDLITLSELKSLGCTINDNYSYTSGLSCKNSSYVTWLANGQFWWTRSATSTAAEGVWTVNGRGRFNANYYSDLYGMRPVIIISKDTLLSLG